MRVFTFLSCLILSPCILCERNISISQNDIFEEFFTWRIHQSPEFATLIGIKDYNDILETFTEDRFASDRGVCQSKYLVVEVIEKYDFVFSVSEGCGRSQKCDQ